MNLANGARGDELANLDAEGEVAGPDSLHEEEILGLGGGHELLGLGGIDGQGLFAEDVFAGLEGKHGVLEVVAVRGGDVDDVDVGVGDELGVGAVGLCGARAVDLFDEAGGAVAGAGRRDGDDFVANVADFTDSGVAEEITAEGCEQAVSRVVPLLRASGERGNSLSAMPPVAMMPHLTVKGV